LSAIIIETVQRIVVTNDPPTVRTIVYRTVPAPPLSDRLNTLAETDEPWRLVIVSK
jgi:hypothetical protein